ncbi:hypothetical protein BSU04_44570 [Caballeronia sordidicola]|uniref:Uncharacterized protein n=1 Tax=Caballeronia sordidicola TaxID=196367 RepID=A0A226WM24_CABSO|nr:hypothetical protein BSU04_44570 [Caballeronia sordidicola]
MNAQRATGAGRSMRCTAGNERLGLRAVCRAGRPVRRVDQALDGRAATALPAWPAWGIENYNERALRPARKPY